MANLTLNNILDVSNLDRSFGGVKAVDDCSFVVKKGTITALIGPNGAGKSTVFNLISGIIKAQSGRVSFLGKDITNQSIEEISNLGISRLFQQSRPYKNLTVEESLLLAFDNEDTKFWKNLFNLYRYTKDKKEKINSMLEVLDLVEHKHKLIGNLSYGQNRLVDLTRAVLNPHQLLMLDEPVAGINPHLRRKMSDFLTKLRQQGETILLIEHDMQFTLNLSDVVIVMDEGKVIAQGKPTDIRRNKKVLEAYLGD